MFPGIFPLMKHPILRRRVSIPESCKAWKDKSNKRLAPYGVMRASLVLMPSEMLSKLVTFFKKLPRAGSLTCVLALKKQSLSMIIWQVVIILFAYRMRSGKTFSNGSYAFPLAARKSQKEE